MLALYNKIYGKRKQIMARASLLTGLNLSKPSYICAKMTMRCNSRCVHCDIWKIDYNEKELTTEQWIETLNRLHAWLGDFQMVFTGGEALIRPDMLLILRHADALGIGIELLTNGIMINDELAESIVKAGVRQVTISYDGIKPETHDLFRGAEGFHAATSSAIAAFVKYRDLHDRSIKILLKTVISRNNCEELVNVASFAKSQDINIRYQPIEENYAAHHDFEWYLKSNLWIDDLHSFKSQIDILKEMKKSGTKIDNLSSEFDIYVRYFERPTELMSAVQNHQVGRLDSNCHESVSSFLISGNGDVRLCWKMDPIGNVAYQGPKEIWDNRRRCWVHACGFR